VTVYLLHGPDDFALAEFIAGLKAKLGDPATADLNTTVLDGRTVTLPELKSIANTMPFLAPQRLVIIEGWLTKLLSKGEVSEEESESASASSAKETLAQLAEYLPAVPPTTALVLAEKRALPERNALLKALTGKDWAMIKFFDLPKGEGLVKWIMARAKAEGGAFEREAAQALAAAESDPRALGHEITKLLTYVNFARPVELADVETLTPMGGEAKIFDMVDAIGQRRGPAAVRELHKLLDKEEPLYILSMIVRQFRLMLQAKELLEARTSENDISQTLGLHPFPTKKICEQARAFTLPALERIYRRLLDYDEDLKTGKVESATALDTLVVSLTSA
jgi:DNA polymerase-3 subunit delta